MSDMSVHFVVSAASNRHRVKHSLLEKCGVTLCMRVIIDECSLPSPTLRSGISLLRCKCLGQPRIIVLWQWSSVCAWVLRQHRSLYHRGGQMLLMFSLRLREILEQLFNVTVCQVDISMALLFLLCLLDLAYLLFPEFLILLQCFRTS